MLRAGDPEETVPDGHGALLWRLRGTKSSLQQGHIVSMLFFRQTSMRTTMAVSMKPGERLVQLKLGWQLARCTVYEASAHLETCTTRA